MPPSPGAHVVQSSSFITLGLFCEDLLTLPPAAACVCQTVSGVLALVLGFASWHSVWHVVRACCHKAFGGVCLRHCQLKF